MLTVSRKALLDRLEIAAKVCPTRTPKDVLRWVKFDFDGSVLTLTATDQEVGIRLKVHAVSGARCTFLMPAQQTVQVLKDMSTDPLEIHPLEGGNTIKGTRETIRVPAIDPGDFPEWKHTEQCRTTMRGLHGPVGRVVWAADTESTRYALGGIHMAIKGQSCRLEAADSRVAATEPVTIMGPVDWSGVIHTPGLIRAAETMAGDFNASLGHSSVEFSDAETTVYARLVEGRFPDMSKVFPRSFGAEFDIGVGELARVVRLASRTTDKESTGFDLKLADGMLTVDSGAADKGDANIQIPVPTDARCKVSLDSQYLAKLLSVLDPLDVLRWGMNTTDAANQFTVRDWRGLIMPLDPNR